MNRSDVNTSSSSDTDNGSLAEAATVMPGKRRWRKVCAVLLLLAVLGPYLIFRAASFSQRLNMVRPVGSEVSASMPEFDKRLRVVTYNIAHGRGDASSNWKELGGPKAKRVVQIGRFLHGQDADIVVLNEVDFSCTWSGGMDQASAIAEIAGFPHVVKQSNLEFGFIYGRWQFGNAILSKYPIVDASIVNLPPHKAWEDWVVGSKRGVLCTIQLSRSESVQVMGLHLESRSEDSRVAAVDYLLEKFDKLKGPLVVAGDLNTTPLDAPRASRSSDGRNAFDELINRSELTPTEKSGQRIPTFPSWKPEQTIDWILIDPMHFSVLKHQVLETRLSDHLPVMADVQLK